MKKIILILVVSLLTVNMFGQFKIAVEAERLVNPNIIYDSSYVKIPYPNGDIPANRGCCTDLIIRVLYVIGFNLQEMVHEDMVANFDIYPQIYGMKSPDTNIDHRRVPNLMKYFERKIANLPITDNPKDYEPGDIIAWDLGNGNLHMGIVSHTNSKENKDRYMIVHNICCGQVMEDRLFEWKIIGHYNYSYWRK
jgi:uncharacterized protein YijF (DUF1287 family)